MSKLTPDALKKYRSEKHISQETLAKRAGVAPSTISRFESGEGNLNDESEAKIMECMNKTTQDNSTIPGTQEGTSIKKILDDSFIDTTADQVTKGLSEDVETSVATQIQNAHILDTGYTYGEIVQMVTEMEKEIVRKVKSLIRDRL